jgi:hydroxymethylpyrimidine pyrophosphatase-like HAD family hydrolase
LCAYYHNPLAYIVGLDLHGTLLEPGEVIREELVPEITHALERVRQRALVYLCTGNDKSFVDRKVPESIREILDGYVLETGCSISQDKDTETVLTTMDERRTIKNLERLLKIQEFPEVNYFAHRLTSIAMFTDDPPGFFIRVKGFVDETEFREDVDVIYSSVAVDIIPKGYNKFRGLHAAAEGRKTIGIADSINDLPLLMESDYAFSPKNLAPGIIEILSHPGHHYFGRRTIKPLSQASGMQAEAILVAESTETEGVKEILEFLAGNLPAHPEKQRNSALYS